MKKDAAETKAYIDAQQAEERKLLKIIQEADAERSRQKKQLEQVRFRINIFVNLEGHHRESNWGSREPKYEECYPRGEILF